MDGSLFVYKTFPSKLCAFSSNINTNIYFIFTGGLGDGFLTVPYTLKLSEQLESIGIKFVQPLLSSSYRNYGDCSLMQDAQELNELLCYLLSKDPSAVFYLMGHSTGCQIILQFFKDFPTVEIKCAILQGCVSDRESILSKDQVQVTENLKIAKDLIDRGVKFSLMPRSDPQDVPYTAYRYFSLYAKGGDDDMFSSDLDPETFKSNFKTSVPIYAILSEKDEYVHIHVSILKEKFSLVCEKVFVIENADHSVTNSEIELIDIIKQILNK